MSNVIPFSFDQHPVRVVELDGQPWFVASDVAVALEYRDADKLTRLLDEDEAGTHIVGTRSANGVEQDREVLIINESGLYSAILRSRKASAKRFKKWVTAEVLPSIRKTGRYEAAAAQPAEGWREFRFRDESFQVLKEHDRLWFAVQDVAEALDMGPAWHNQLRELNRRSPGQARLEQVGQARVWVMDEAALWDWMRTASVERERELQSWLNRIVRPRLWGRDVQAAPQPQTPAPATAEAALRALVGRARFICSLGDDGGLLFRELVAGEVVMRPEQVAGWIADPAGAPLGCLPAVLQAAGERLVGSSGVPVRRG
ncbi:hypothetical protein D3C78_237590 [compost metagenome]